MKIAFVIPTLGRDLVLLQRALHSIGQLDSDSCIVVVSKSESPEIEAMVNLFGGHLIVEKESGLYFAINQGVASIIEMCDYYTFLGDDDTLDKIGFEKLAKLAETFEPVVMYGGVRYVDETGNTLMTNYSFPKIVNMLLWIPNLIPHPGSLINVGAWSAVGGYDERYKFASDLDFWLKVRSTGVFRFERVIGANFRYSANTLTGGQRKLSLEEAAQIRMSHSKGFQRFILKLWEPLLREIGELTMRWRMRG
jgi:hypothetical protein